MKLWRFCPFTGREPPRAQQSLRPHDIDHEHTLTIVTIKNAAGRLDDLPVARLFQFKRFAAALRKIFQLLDMLKHTLY